MIDNKVIEEIRGKTDIVNIVSDYVALKKRGRNYLALCPFHSEKTASFTVSQEKQMFHCFGCSEGGNVFSFLMKIENVSFIESVKLLADKLGIPLEIGKSGPGPDTRNRKLFDILALAAEFYQQELWNSSFAKEYASKRGLDEKAISSFRLGYSPDSWDKVYRHLTSKGYLPIDIETAGLVLKKEGSASYYDRFRNRLMFPIFDAKGRCVGFGARSLDGLPAGQAGSEPKYLNSPDSPVYNKGSIVFGLNFAREHIKEKDRVLIMEGYMDVITSVMAGFNNAVASSGTSLSMNQVKALQRFTENMVLVFDSDAAGSSATDRSIELLKQAGIYPRVALLSGGKDPDEIIRKEGKDKFAELINKAVPWLVFKLGAVLKKHKITEPEGKAKAVKEAAQLLSKETDPVIQSEYARLLGKKLGISEEHILSEIKSLRPYYSRSRGSRQDIVKPVSKIDKAEKTLIKLCLDDPKIRDTVFEGVKPEDLLYPVNREIFEKLPLLESGEKDDALAGLVDALPSDEAKRALTAIAFDDNELMDPERTLTDCVNALKANALKIRIDGLKAGILEAEKKKDLESIASLQEEYKKCHEEMRAF